MSESVPIPAAEWVPFEGGLTGHGGSHVWYSTAEHDPAWDDFLRATPLGQFQQSSAWGRIKRLEGWRTIRFLVTHGDRLVAGFQLLWKSKFGLRFGYVSKGPVVVGVPEVFGPNDAVTLLRGATRHLRLSALVAQAPDLGQNLEAPMAATGFLEYGLQDVYSATILVNLDRPFAEVERGFSRDVGRQIRSQKKNNVQVRFGDAADAELFFDLMKQTCVKQKVAPNPSSADSVRAILHEFHARAADGLDPMARCLFAEHKGRTIAGFLMIRFGKRLVLWKKGAAGDAGRAQPNRLLDSTAMQWGHGIGCMEYELVGLDRGAATSLLAGRPMADVVMKSAEVYKLFFGGTPVLLPEARVWVPNSSVRLAYRAFVRLRACVADLGAASRRPVVAREN